MAMHHPLRVSEIHRLTTKSVVLTFEVPETLTSVFQYEAGQYLSLEETLEGETVRRSYSICSAPSETKLQVGIKQIPNGRFSSYVNQQVLQGSVLSVGPPEGRFVLGTPKEGVQYTGIAAGSGITPIWAIIKEILNATKTSSFYLIYSNKSAEEEMFTNEINDLILLHPKRFFVFRTYSQKEVKGHAYGRIGSALLDRYFEEIGFSSERFFLCGPEGMIHMASDYLKEKGVPGSALYFELFTSSPSKNAGPALFTGNYRLQVTCDSVTTPLEGTSGKSILDVALQNKLDAPYSCQGGVCSSCIARITKGTATMTSNQILTDEEIEEGLILSCQAHPTSPEIAVDYDDV